MSEVMMKKFLLLFLFLETSDVYANTTYLDCSVKGSLSSSFENKTLRESNVSLEITDYGKDLIITISR